jgi:hypothetical protein
MSSRTYACHLSDHNPYAGSGEGKFKNLRYKAPAICAATFALFSNSEMFARRVAPWLRSDIRASKKGVKSRPAMFS